jgi:hypothetical protein
MLNSPTDGILSPLRFHGSLFTPKKNLFQKFEILPIVILDQGQGLGYSIVAKVSQSSLFFLSLVIYLSIFKKGKIPQKLKNGKNTTLLTEG